jgi:hypothetical protein
MDGGREELRKEVTVIDESQHGLGLEHSKFGLDWCRNESCL